ncbi:MAG: hypothetical protein IMY70_01750 [Bacteroidetes bacterium]|nr:hypothetical protein [Bacteroidota bacterium]
MLVLTIVILSLGIITLYAQPILDKTKNDLYFSNMEQSFVLLYSDTNNIASEKSTISTRDMNLINAPIFFNPNSTQITILTETHEPITFKTGSIEYNNNELKFSLENGALLSSYSTGTLMIREPFIYTIKNSNGNVTIIDLIMLEGPDFSVGGTGIVRIIQQKNYSESYISQQQQNISINITSQYAEGWAHYFEKQGYDVTIESSNVVKTDIKDTQLRIMGTAIGVSLDRALPIHSPINDVEVVITTPSGVMDGSCLQVNATINNTGNQDMNNITVQMNYSSKYNWEIEPLDAVPDNIKVGNSIIQTWNVSTNTGNNEALFWITVSGTGNSSWINPFEYQTRSNKIRITRC